MIYEFSCEVREKHHFSIANYSEFLHQFNKMLVYYIYSSTVTNNNLSWIELSNIIH